MKTKTPTEAQKIFGKDFGNKDILNERPDNMRSKNPEVDKVLFRNYKIIRRRQTKIIKKVIH